MRSLQFVALRTFGKIRRGDFPLCESGIRSLFTCLAFLYCHSPLPSFIFTFAGTLVKIYSATRANSFAIAFAEKTHGEIHYYNVVRNFRYIDLVANDGISVLVVRRGGFVKLHAVTAGRFAQTPRTFTA